MEYEEIGNIKPRFKPGAFGGKGFKPKKDNTALALTGLVVAMITIILLSVAFNLVDIRNPFSAITGDVVADTSTKTGSQQGDATVKTIKNLKFNAEIYAESFEIPAESVDVTIEAAEVQLLSPTLNIVDKPSEPVVIQAFSGIIYWRDGFFVLQGKIGKYQSKTLEMNWNAEQDIKIRVLKGSVSIPQVSVPTFNTMATGTITLADKATFTADKDLLSLDHYRGSFKAEIDEDSAKVFLDGSTEDMTLGNEQLSFNVE